MKIRFVAAFGFALCTTACQPTPAAAPTSTTPAAENAAAPAPAPTPEPAPAPAPAPAHVEAPTTSAAPPPTAAAPPSSGVETSVVEVKNEITTPKVVSPDQVIASLRPQLNACYQDGLKKDPTLAGSVTLSAKIEKDGKVSAVTPKMVEGLTPAVLKCLGDRVKAASFAVAGGMNYATSIDIPVRFATN